MGLYEKESPLSKPAGNDLWWSQVASKQENMPKGTHWKDAELELMAHIIRTMIKDGEPMGRVTAHFKDVFGLGTTAFYARMKKMGTRWVLPIEFRQGE